MILVPPSDDCPAAGRSVGAGLSGVHFGDAAVVTSRLIIEQNAHIALQVAHQGYVMETGRIVMKGAARELAQDAHVKKAYLGL